MYHMYTNIFYTCIKCKKGTKLGLKNIAISSLPILSYKLVRQKNVSIFLILFTALIKPGKVSNALYNESHFNKASSPYSTNTQIKDFKKENYNNSTGKFQVVLIYMNIAKM